MTQHPPSINQRIWQVVAAIPSGKVTTYGSVAQQAGMPGAARRVGMALRALPVDSRIPWHRVVNTRGHIALPAATTAHHTQRRRLEAEGVRFSPAGRIRLQQFGWCSV